MIAKVPGFKKEKEKRKDKINNLSSSSSLEYDMSIPLGSVSASGLLNIILVLNQDCPWPV